VAGAGLVEDAGEEADEGVGFGEEGVVAVVHARLCHCAGSRLPWKQAMRVSKTDLNCLLAEDKITPLVPQKLGRKPKA
jgi:hypothetical protein